MLVKSHTNTYLEDYGIMTSDGIVHLFENGKVHISECSPVSPVLRVNAFWVKKDIKARCVVADTQIKKRIGLQGHERLDDNCGMYFPYIKYADVSFHQGSVPFGLDLVFLRDNEIIKIKSNTIPKSRNIWRCSGCDGVVEFNSGFCSRNGVDINDKVDFFAITQKDINDLEEERRNGGFLTTISDRIMNSVQ